MGLSSYYVSAMTRRRPLTPVQSWQSASVAPGGASSSVHASSTFFDDGGTGRHQERSLKRTLNLQDLIFYGVGCSVGAGIYSLVGIGANLAGPSIALSFFLCGVACCFTSLSYAEFAARVPLAGSAYVFAYVSFGELVGWLVGWNLTLGYAVSAAAVARSWAEYVVGFVEGFAFFDKIVTSWLTKFPIPAFGDDYTCCPLAMVIIAFCTVVLVSGVKESTRFNTVMTLLNLSILGFVLLGGIGSGTVHSDNLEPVFPHGISGMARGAGLVFFAYLGFDMVACLSEEVKNPERNMPIGIIGSLLISMSIYVGVSLVVVGMAPVNLLGEDVPIINALLANACCSHSEQLQVNAAETCLSFSCHPIAHPLLYYGSRIISFGAIFGLTTSTFACLMGQPRIFYSMALDGLLFPVYARVHPETGVPTIGTLLTGIFTAVVACFTDLESLANAISLGTLQVFTFVNAGIILLRMQPTVADLSPDSAIHEMRSPIVRNVHAATMARSLGIVKQTSRSIRQIVRQTSRFTTERTIHDNGSKPIWMVVLFITGATMSSMAFSRGWHDGVCILFAVVALVSAIILFILPKSETPLNTFMCPAVPAVPLLGILCNSYMMGSLDAATWNFILAWLLVGVMFYFSYGIHHSLLRDENNSRKSTASNSDAADNINTGLLRARATTPDYNSVELLPPQGL